MKHNKKITFLILFMFLITQFIGIYVINYYSPVKISSGDLVKVSSPGLPYGLDVQEPQNTSQFAQAFTSLIFAFMVAIFLLLLLSKINAEVVLRFWFFSVVAIALAVSFNVIFNQLGIVKSSVIAIFLGVILSFVKIYRRGFIIHNLTEFFVYPGIAAVFVPILNIYTMVLLLILISIYDMWAVWRSGIMQKMAKYQISKLNIFSGFFIPYMSKKMRMKIKKMRKSELKKKKFKVNLAVLGGGDIVFPIITAGVILKTKISMPFGLHDFTGGLIPAIFVVLGATLGLSYLLFFSEKKKFYPAMPFITAGIFLGMVISYILF